MAVCLGREEKGWLVRKGRDDCVVACLVGWLVNYVVGCCIVWLSDCVVAA